jgi:hypothetical protein
LPHLDALNDKYAASGVQVLAIDVSGRKELTQKMATDASYKAPVLVDDKDFSRKEYKIVATPTTCIVDRSGKMIFRHVGYGPGVEKVLEKEIDLLLARKTA